MLILIKGEIMKKTYKLILMLMLAATLLLSGCGSEDTDASGAGAGSSNGAETSENASPVEFTAADIDGNTVTSDIFSKSKLTMVNVWATYCNPCISEMPALAEIAEAYDASEFQIVGVISDVMEGDDVSGAEKLISQTKADYLHLVINESLYNSMLTGVSAVPTTIFVDSEGKTVNVVVGAKGKEDWENLINEMLKEV